MNDTTARQDASRARAATREEGLVDWVGLKRAAAWWTAGLVLLALLASRVRPAPSEATSLEPAAAR
jgi:hypothetical protein